MRRTPQVPSLRVDTAPFLGDASLPGSLLAFRVARDGEFLGRRFRVGEIALVHGAPEDGDAVVLVTRGPGRPRLGRVQGCQLVGDRGEPCLGSRWEVAGRVVGVARPAGAVWVVDGLEGPDAFEPLPVEVAAAECSESDPVVRVSSQLDLFAA